MMILRLAARLSGWIPSAVIGFRVAQHAAFAAPFCLTSLAIPPQCLYYDVTLCNRDSAKQGGNCVPNPAEQHAGVGSGQYCMMTSQGVTLCNFLNRESCAAEAVRQHGACYHDEQRAAGVPDPYASSGGPQALPATGQ
jgi:hypothetical protein